MQRRMGLMVGVAAAAVLVLALAASARPPRLWRDLDIDLGTVPPTTLGASTTTTTQPPGTSEPVDLGWLGSALLLLLATVAVVSIVWWLSRRQWQRPARPQRAFITLPEIAPEELLDAADDFELLIARGSARNAIVACWVRLEEAVEQAGLARDPAETPTEMTQRVLRAYAVDADSIGTLATLYREARFSTHDMHEGHRHDAQQALGEIRRQLRSNAEQAAAGSTS